MTDHEENQEFERPEYADNESIRRRLGRIRRRLDNLCWLTLYLAVVNTFILLTIWGGVFR